MRTAATRLNGSMALCMPRIYGRVPPQTLQGLAIVARCLWELAVVLRGRVRRESAKRTT